MTGLHCEMGAEWECHVTLLNGLPGVGPGGKDGSIHKGPLKGCIVGTRLALVLLPFHGIVGMSGVDRGGGCCLVLTEWIDSFRRIGERRLINTMLHFIQFANSHYVQLCSYTTGLLELLLHFVHTANNRLLHFHRQPCKIFKRVTEI